MAWIMYPVLYVQALCAAALLLLIQAIKAYIIACRISQEESRDRRQAGIE
jgi:hypothetical protein